MPLFGTLNQRQLRRLSRRFSERLVEPGVSVVNKGPVKDRGFFVIVGGVATVTIDGRRVATLSPGDHFGELGMVGARARFATVTAATRLRLLEIRFSDFRDFALTNPDVTWKLLQHVVELLTAERDA